MGFSNLLKRTVIYSLAIWLVFFFFSTIGINLVPTTFFMSNVWYIIIGYLAINVLMVKY